VYPPASGHSERASAGEDARTTAGLESGATKSGDDLEQGYGNIETALGSGDQHLRRIGQELSDRLAERVEVSNRQSDQAGG